MKTLSVRFGFKQVIKFSIFQKKGTVLAKNQGQTVPKAFLLAKRARRAM
jgi:hypothetical protein